MVGDAPLVDVVRWMRGELARGAARLVLDLPDPDGPSAVHPDGPRSWRAWIDLAEGLHCAMHTPRVVGDGVVRVAFSPLGPEAPWHAAAPGPGRYAEADGFGAVHKLEHPGFLLPLLAALEGARPPDGGRVLVLGCHRGDEIAALDLLEAPPRALRVVGVDHAGGPLAEAAARFPEATFLHRDVADLPADLGRFDLAIAVDVVQGPRVDTPALLRRLVQHHLEASSALVLGLPNSRFRGGEAVWGARTRNYAEPDLSLVVKDLAAARRYLHQHGFRTHVGGKYDLLLRARR